jgi:succinate dehydrogenase / fumarate reductase flavoprotein subunit
MAGDNRTPDQIPESDRDYYLERKYPSFGNLAPRDISSRAAKERIDAGCGVGPMKNAVYLDFKDAIARDGAEKIRQRYGNLFDMYRKITGMNAYKEPMMIAPSAHFSMGGLWVDYELMSNVKGLFVLGEANFSDHGANRLGANSLLQACVDGYFIAPHTVMNYLANQNTGGNDEAWKTAAATVEAEVGARLDQFLSKSGSTTAEEFHKELGKILYTKCGLSRNREQLLLAYDEVMALKGRFEEDLRIPGEQNEINFELEKAGRVADYMEMALLIIQDALQREESCGAHFREEYQTTDGEALRNDKDFQYVSLWESIAPGEFVLHKEQLQFEFSKVIERSYK